MKTLQAPKCVVSMAPPASTQGPTQQSRRRNPNGPRVFLWSTDPKTQQGSHSLGRDDVMQVQSSTILSCQTCAAALRLPEMVPGILSCCAEEGVVQPKLPVLCSL